MKNQKQSKNSPIFKDIKPLATTIIKLGEANAYIFSYSLETCTYFVMVHEGINEYSREELAEVFELTPTKLDYIDDLLDQEWGKLFD